MRITRFVTVLLPCILLVAVVACNDSTYAGQTVQRLTFNGSDLWGITRDEYGLDRFNIGGCIGGWGINTSTGNPILPEKGYDIIFPPDVIWPSVELKIVAIQTHIIGGTYNLAPACPDDGCEYNGTWPDWQGQGKSIVIVNGRNVDVYEKDSYYPKECIGLINHYSQMRKWKLMKVLFFPFQYNPITGKLLLIESVTVDISCDRSPDQIDEAAMKDTVMDDVAAEFYNFEQAKHWYIDEEKGWVVEP